LRSTFNAALASIVLTANASTGKELIRFKRSCLYAPKQNGAIATTREQPLGCRTIFVGGLPENVDEDILQEIFHSVCGDICAIRMSKKNFCHIRFESEDCIEKAIALSGYRMKINDLEDAPNSGRLHID
jgi:RNA recognition motif-containing protein